MAERGAYYALVYALGRLPATITSVGLLAQIPCTAALAWLLLGEPLTPVQMAGGALVLVGIYVVNREARGAGRCLYVPQRPRCISPNLKPAIEMLAIRCGASSSSSSMSSPSFGLREPRLPVVVRSRSARNTASAW